LPSVIGSIGSLMRLAAIRSTVCRAGVAEEGRGAIGRADQSPARRARRLAAAQTRPTRAENSSRHDGTLIAENA
jgi:hypothetical protein